MGSRNRLTIMCALLMIAGTTSLLLAPERAARADVPPLTETSPANEVADLIQQAGETLYSNTFAGVTPTDGADVTLFTTSAASALISWAGGVASENGVTLSQQSVTNSWTTMNSVTSQIANDYDALAGDNINLAEVGPDVETNTVLVLLAPSPMPHPTNSEYVSDAQADIDTLVGPGAATVSTTIESELPTPDASRDSDPNPPYTGGDGIEITGENSYCTDSWKVADSDGDSGTLTAGHCGPGSVHMQIPYSTVLGPVIDRHYDDALHNDFEVAHASVYDTIWKSGHARLTPYEADDPGDRTQVTINGDYSGEHSGLLVVAEDKCVFYAVSHVQVCGIDKVQRGSGACAGGDSGGPVYHYLPSGHIEISGIEVAHTATLCYVETYNTIATNGDMTFVLGA